MMATNDDNVQYIYISKLDQLSAIQPADLFVVSHLSNDATGEYESCKLEYRTIKEDIYDYISVAMSSDTDLSIISSLDALTQKVDDMISAIDICISACVALDNCRNNVRYRVEQLEHDVFDIKRRLKSS